MKSLNIAKTVSTLCAGIFLASVLGCGHQSPQAREWDDSEGWLGVHVQDLDRELRRYYDFDEDGVLVNRVVEESPAEKSGIREEDLITRFDGKRIRDSRDLIRAVRRLSPGEKAEVEVLRNSDRKELSVRLGEKPEHRYTYNYSTPRAFVYGSGRRPWLGVQLTDLNPELAEYFKVDEDDGVLILSVSENGPAEKAGLKAGDVIYEIDGRKVRHVDEIMELLSEYRRADEVEVSYYRHGDEERTRVELDRSRHSYNFNFDADAWRKHPDHPGERRDHRRNMADDIRERIRHEIRMNLRNNPVHVPEIHIPEIHIPEIEIPELELHLEHLENDLEFKLDGLNHELEAELEGLGRELQRLDIRLKRFGDSI